MRLMLTAVLLLLASAAALRAQDVPALIAESDKYSEAFDNQRSLDAIRKAEARDPNNYAVLWRYSRVLVDIAEHLPSSTDKQRDDQLAMFQRSMNYAERAVKVNPKGMMGYLRRAIANGRIALFKGVFTVIGLVKDVKQDLEKAIKLNNETPYQQALAHYVLGRTHAKVCEKAYLVRLPLGLGWGDRDIAAAEYEKAISMDPNFIMFRVDAARNYIEMDEEDKAMAHLARVAQLPVRDEDDPGLKKEAARLLAELKAK
jgi:tetratricopeptide (TPR) repeat protein